MCERHPNPYGWIKVLENCPKSKKERLKWKLNTKSLSSKVLKEIYCIKLLCRLTTCTNDNPTSFKRHFASLRTTFQQLTNIMSTVCHCHYDSIRQIFGTDADRLHSRGSLDSLAAFRLVSDDIQRMILS